MVDHRTYFHRGFINYHHLIDLTIAFITISTTIYLLYFLTMSSPSSTVDDVAQRLQEQVNYGVSRLRAAVAACGVRMDDEVHYPPHCHPEEVEEIFGNRRKEVRWWSRNLAKELVCHVYFCYHHP